MHAAGRSGGCPAPFPLHTFLPSIGCIGAAVGLGAEPDHRLLVRGGIVEVDVPIAEVACDGLQLLLIDEHLFVLPLQRNAADERRMDGVRV